MSRSLIRKLPSLSVTRPHGAARSETIAWARGSPRDWTVLGVGLLAELDSVAATSSRASGPAVRVSGLGSLAELVHPVTRRSAPQAATKRRAAHPMPCWQRCCGHAHSLACVPKRVSRSQVSGVQDLDRLRLADQFDLGHARPAVGVQHQLARRADEGDGRGAAHRPNCFRSTVCVGGT